MTTWFRVPFGEAERSLLTFAPRLLCDAADGDSTCGKGLGLGLRDTTLDGLHSFEARIDAERVGSSETYGVSLNFEHRF